MVFFVNANGKGSNYLIIVFKMLFIMFTWPSPTDLKRLFTTVHSIRTIKMKINQLNKQTYVQWTMTMTAATTKAKKKTNKWISAISRTSAINTYYVAVMYRFFSVFKNQISRLRLIGWLTCLLNTTAGILLHITHYSLLLLFSLVEAEKTYCHLSI